MRIAIVGLTALALAGCGKTPEEKARDPEAVRQDVKAAATMMAGEWERQFEITDVQISGIPAEVAERMKQQKRQDRYCLTPEQAEKRAADMFKQNGDCNYERFSMAGGKIDARMICVSKGERAGAMPGKSDITMSGGYSADAYSIALDMKIFPPNAPQGTTIAMKSKIDGKRVASQCEKQQ